MSTVELFHWWRAADWTAIRTAVLGAGAYPIAVRPLWRARRSAPEERMSYPWGKIAA